MRILFDEIKLQGNFYCPWKTGGSSDDSETEIFWCSESWPAQLSSRLCQAGLQRRRAELGQSELTIPSNHRVSNVFTSVSQGGVYSGMEPVTCRVLRDGEVSEGTE